MDPVLEKPALPSGKRETWCDVCKGLGILLVILGHVITNGTSAGVIQGSVLLRVCDVIYSFHMPLFFFLSGFLTKSHDSETVRYETKYFAKKELGLLFPYLIFSFIYLALKVVAGNSDAIVHPASLSDYLEVYRHPIGEYWYLYSLMVSVVVLYGVILLFRLMKKKMIFALSCILFAGAFILYLFSPIPASVSEGLHTTCSFFIYFFSGYLLKNYIPVWRRKPYLISAICFAIGTTLLTLRLTETADALPLRFVTAMCFIIDFALLFSDIPSPFLANVGRSSLPIYLIHPFVLVAVRLLLTKLSLTQEYIFTLLSFLLTVGITYSVYVFVIAKVRFFDFFIYPMKYFGKTVKK